MIDYILTAWISCSFTIAATGFIFDDLDFRWDLLEFIVILGGPITLILGVGITTIEKVSKYYASRRNKMREKAAN